MSWIRTTCCFALASLVWLAPAIAQQPQLAPPQYGISDGYADASPPSNFAPLPLAAPATNDDARENLRLLNQPAAITKPASTNDRATYQQPISLGGSPSDPPLNIAAASTPATNTPTAGSSNVTTRPEPQPSFPNIQATYQQPLAPSTSPVALPLHGPGNTIPANNVPANNTNSNTNSNKPLPLAGPNTKTTAAASGWSSFGTMLGSLAIVLGLFVFTIKLLRRGMPGAKQRLGRDVVEVLGQTPLANRQSLQVIRFGNKILLVAMSPDGCDTLTEITDPLEVDRLAGMCQQAQASSATKSFGEMFRQVTSIRPAANELADEPPPTTPALDEVRARLRGGSLATREVTHG